VCMWLLCLCMWLLCSFVCGCVCLCVWLCLFVYNCCVAVCVCMCEYVCAHLSLFVCVCFGGRGGGCICARAFVHWGCVFINVYTGSTSSVVSNAD